MAEHPQAAVGPAHAVHSQTSGTVTYEQVGHELSGAVPASGMRGLGSVVGAGCGGGGRHDRGADYVSHHDRDPKQPVGCGRHGALSRGDGGVLRRIQPPQIGRAGTARSGPA